MFTRTAAFWALAVLSGSVAAGCNTPGSLCQGTVDRTNALYERCGYALHVVLVLDGMPRECGNVNRVDNPDGIALTCWPYLDNVDCADLVEGEPGRPMLDPSCDFSHFTSY